MVTRFIYIALIVILTLTAAAQPTAQQAGENGIKEVIGKYEKALNSGDLNGVVEVFAADAVVMPIGASSLVGREEIRAFYRDSLLALLSLRITLKPVDIILLGDWAVARTQNSGTSTAKSDGSSQPINTKSLIVLHKTDSGSWTFARYMWNPNN